MQETSSIAEDLLAAREGLCIIVLVKEPLTLSSVRGTLKMVSASLVNTKLAKHQYSETNVRHFVFSLLKIKGLYMFRTRLAHPQEALYKRHLVYCVHVVSVGCTLVQALKFGKFVHSFRYFVKPKMCI
jgi:hypothetical protein